MLYRAGGNPGNWDKYPQHNVIVAVNQKIPTHGGYFGVKRQSQVEGQGDKDAITIINSGKVTTKRTVQLN